MPELNVPQVSVIMSVYNGQPLLERAIQSILSQTFADFELIILDDGSTDKSWEIVHAYADTDQRIMPVRNQQNIGLTQSLNKGLALAEGEIIARQDADDISVADRFEKQVAYLETHPAVGLVGSVYEFVSEDGQSLEIVDVPMQNEVLQEHLVRYNCFCHGAVMFRRSCIDQVGNYRTFLKTAQDYDLWLRMAEHFEIANLPDRLYLYRLAPDCIGVEKLESQMKNIKLIQHLCWQRRNLGYEDASQNNKEGLFNDRNSTSNRQELIYRHLRNARLLYLAGNTMTARESFEKARNLAAGTLPEDMEENKFFFDWLLKYAQRFARQKQAREAGAQFITSMLSNPEDSTTEINHFKDRLLGAYYIKAAFSSHNLGDMHLVRSCLKAAIRHDKRWLWNKGVLSIGLDALLGYKRPKLSERLKGDGRA